MSSKLSFDESRFSLLGTQVLETQPANWTPEADFRKIRYSPITIFTTQILI